MECAVATADIEDTIPVPRDLRDLQEEQGSQNFQDKLTVLHQVVQELLSIEDFATNLDSHIRQAQRVHHMNFSHPQLLYAYRTLVKSGQIEPNLAYEAVMKSKTVRGTSGVIVVTVLTSPWPLTAEQEYGKDHDARFTDQFVKDDQMIGLSKTFRHFSCKYDCFYCPAEPGMPRSYLMKEPAVARGNQHRFDAVAQFRDRGTSYLVNGHPFDKIELLVLGGTWSSYPRDYQEEFIRDLYYAANTFDDINFSTSPRPRRSVSDEIKLNETSNCRIIGLTLETRPDQINPEELRRYRYFGVTRVQLGIQHTDNEILRYVNRRCTTETAIQSICMLKDTGFKVDIHLMPDLPSSNVEKDRQMFEEVLNSEAFQPDQIKIYPCEVVPWTRIETWYRNYKKGYDTVTNPENLGPYDNRIYHPYAEDKYELTLTNRQITTNPLFELLIQVSAKMPPWIRVNRIIRDIPMSYVSGGNDCANLRQSLEAELKKRGLMCRCIRCREVKGRRTNLEEAKLVVRKYRASGGEEYFLSFESPDGTIIYGFLRLRLSPNSGAGIFPELDKTAMIRELHVYGKVVPVAKRTQDATIPQHGGFGKQLLREAEKIAQENGLTRISVIAGVGVREYYRKQGYRDEGAYQIKPLVVPSLWQRLISSE